jgi:phosphohistidine phosphatase
MDLILWRHADAEPGMPDAARRLTPKGERQAEKVGAWLDRHLPDDTTILVSPAVRAQQTALGLGRKFRTVDAIAPGASAAEVLAAAGWPGGRGSVLVVGHQPALGEAAARLLAGEEAYWAVKKGAFWWLSQRDHDDAVVLRAVLGPDLV